MNIMFATDDNESMVYAEKGIRIKQLQIVLNNFARVYNLARDKGIVRIRFLKAIMGRNNITVKKVRDCLRNHDYGGLRRVGTELKSKILDMFVLKDMKKPLLVIVTIDGEVGSPNDQYSPFFPSNS